MKRKLSLILGCLFLFAGMALAQNKITGTVVSQADGLPIIGASVQIQGTKTGVVTNTDGNFTLDVPAGKKLVISYIGMVTQTVSARQGMKVALTDDNNTIGEVVVTGMSTQDKRTFSGATTKINAADAKIDGMADISRSLEGRSAGVSVQNVSGTFGNIHLRCTCHGRCDCCNHQER